MIFLFLTGSTSSQGSVLFPFFFPFFCPLPSLWFRSWKGPVCSSSLAALGGLLGWPRTSAGQGRTHPRPPRRIRPLPRCLYLRTVLRRSESATVCDGRYLQCKTIACYSSSSHRPHSPTTPPHAIRTGRSRSLLPSLSYCISLCLLCSTVLFLHCNLSNVCQPRPHSPATPPTHR